MIKRTDSLIHRIYEKAFKQSILAVVDELLSPAHFAYNAFGGLRMAHRV